MMKIVLLALLLISPVLAFAPPSNSPRKSYVLRASTQSTLVADFLSLASRTNRGFDASTDERQQARSLIFELAKYSPTPEPASSYYEVKSAYEFASTTDPSIAGKWTLVYTDAPDITSLKQNALAELGRIGQECEPPFIKNVIEWKRPSWASSLPFSGPPDARVLQKVVTKAKASPDRPTVVDLELSGIQVTTDITGTDSLFEAIQNKGLVAGLAQTNPIDLQGPLTTPFGQFEVLYLDDDLRIIRTQQGYYAANLRIKDMQDEWF